MNDLFDLQALAQMPRQRHFLTQLLPALQQRDWVGAIWLSGSLARKEGDRWSSVNLHLLVTPQIYEQVSEQLTNILWRVFSTGWHQSARSTGLICGITYVPESADAMRGGVRFALRWVAPDGLPSNLHWHRPTNVIFVHDNLPIDLKALLTTERSDLLGAEPEVVGDDLVRFWEELALLPAVINRSEQLAATQLLAQIRQILIDLVVALNGAQRPATPSRINPFLGDSQRDAFEKTLLAKNIDARAWIGQAVSMIVLYRWYAPQLVEKYGLIYPGKLEATILALLSAEVDGWPALIKTD